MDAYVFVCDFAARHVCIRIRVKSKRTSSVGDFSKHIAQQTRSPNQSADVSTHSADVDQTVFLVVDPHFGVIDDAGYDPVCVCFACVRDYIHIQKSMSNLQS